MRTRALIKKSEKRFARVCLKKSTSSKKKNKSNENKVASFKIAKFTGVC